MPYYGSETEKSLHNFPYSLGTTNLALMFGIVEIKKAAAKVHSQIGELEEYVAEAIVDACNEILDHHWDEEFVTSRFQGGAGTSINMNVNEVIAARATVLLRERGRDFIVHPNDHVNMSQSTNDVNPSALRFVVYKMAVDVNTSAKHLATTFKSKADEFMLVCKLGRTHLQDAVPTTLGAEFAAYAEAIDHARKGLHKLLPTLLKLNLGGTAIGTGINASLKYRKLIYKELSNDVGLRLEPAKNLMAATSDQADFLVIASALNRLMLVVSKIASDIRLLSSGPRTGFAEIHEPELQAGSSIMPGKVNPIISEVVNQAYFMTSANSKAIELATINAQLELGVMFPLIADRLLESAVLARETLDIFADKCISHLEVDQDHCVDLLEHSFGYATMLTPRLGYDAVSKAVKTALKLNLTLREVIVKKEKLLSNKEFNELTSQGLT